jgi:hypothetical protein
VEPLRGPLIFFVSGIHTVMEAANMEGTDHLGTIRLDVASPDLSHDRWLDVIIRYPLLIPDRPARRINPFTRQAMFGHRVRVMIDGEEAGELLWMETDHLEIIVSGDDQSEHAREVMALAEEIAAPLGGHFERPGG